MENVKFCTPFLFLVDFYNIYSVYYFNFYSLVLHVTFTKTFIVHSGDSVTFGSNVKIIIYECIYLVYITDETVYDTRHLK